MYFHNLLIIWQTLFLINENPCPFASPAFEVTLSGLAGGEYLPLQASKGLAFPFLLTLDGYPTSLQQFTLKDNGFLQRLRKLQASYLLTEKANSSILVPTEGGLLSKTTDTHTLR